MNLLDKMKTLMAIKKVRIGVSIVLSVAVVAAGGAAIYTVMNDKPATSQETKVEKRKKTEKKEEKEIKYETFHMSSDSMEKDLTVYFTDAKENKIAGTEFSVKLVKPEEAKKLDDQLKDIADINEQLNPTDQDSANKDAEKNAEGEESTKQEDKDTVSKDTKTENEKDILNKKATAIEAYAKVLDKLEGKVLTDDDKDGMIDEQELEPGEFVLCYIPTGSYDAEEYAVKATVKEKVDYKVVEDIEKKKVSYAAAGDTQGAGHNVSVEATLPDTVQWVDPSKKEVDEVQKTDFRPEYMASVNGTNITLYAASVANSVDVNVMPTASSQIGASGADVLVKEDISNGAGTAYRLSIAANGVANTQDIPVTLSGNVFNVHIIGGAEPVVNKEGMQLYADEAMTQPATVGTYNPNASYYVKGSKTVYTGWQTIDGKRYYFDANGQPVAGKQVIGGVQYTFDSTGELLTRSAGIDVSKWQGNIDWSQVKSAVSFAIVRAGFRGSSGGIAEDPKAGANIQGASANGLKVGVYFYSIAMNEAQAVEEASLAVAIARKYGGVTLPIYIDMEDSRQLGLSTGQRDAIVMAFCNTVRSAGYSAGVYANKNWFTNYLTPSSYGNVSIWLAQYNTEVTYKGRYDIWQYSSKGSIPGISGNVDLNTSFF